MSENKNFLLFKTTPNDVIFVLHPLSNPSLSRLIHMKKAMTKIALPLDWALGVFFDEGVRTLYEKGIIAFDDNEAACRAAFEAGVYWSEELLFTPAKSTDEQDIFAILKSGVRMDIMNAINTYGKDKVLGVAAGNKESLTTGVVSLLEKELHVQLSLSEE